MDDRNLTIERTGPTLAASLGRALDLAQRVALDELRLLQLGSQEQVQRAVRGVAWLGAGLFCASLAWVGLLGALVVALEDRMSLETRLAVVAGSQLLLGLGLIGWGLRERREPR